jgi:CRISPR-associated endonuclease Csn1
MAETICAVLELDPTKSTATFTEKNPAYKTQNAAFPRNAVLNEVTLILAKHQHLLSLAHAAHLMQDDLTLEQRDNLSKAGIKLPKRYLGGLLFGQLVPRFDNRIIARCPITWAKLYDQVMAKENDEEKARHVADRDAKVPVKNCHEFYRYR